MCDEAKKLMDKAVANIMRDTNVEIRMRNTVIYGTSHPEIYKTAQDEEIEALRAENAKLCAALKPLSEIADNHSDKRDDYPLYVRLLVGELRAARAALGEIDE